MLKRRGWRTHLIILRGRCWIIDFLLDVRHCPVIPDHAFRSSVRHHADLSRCEKKKRYSFRGNASLSAITDIPIVRDDRKNGGSLAREYIVFSLQSGLHFFFAPAIFKHGQRARLEHF